MRKWRDGGFTGIPCLAIYYSPNPGGVMRTCVVTYKCDLCQKAVSFPFNPPGEEDEEWSDLPKGWFWSPLENQDYCGECLAKVVPFMHADGTVSPPGTYEVKG